MNDRTFIRTLVITGAVAVLLVFGAGWYCSNKVLPDSIQTMKDEMAKIEKYDKCINGFVYRKHLSADLYYEYHNDGKPVKCVTIAQ